MADRKVGIKGVEVRFKKIDKEDNISLTDLARYANPTEPKVPIATWMRSKDVISYLFNSSSSSLSSFTFVGTLRERL